MNCPTCGRELWLRDPETLTCKEGHRLAVGAPADPSTRLRARRAAPHALYGAAGGAMAAVLVELGTHLLL